MFSGISSFTDEIKVYEERLANNPDSLLFARLAQAYLDAGRGDEALLTARSGVARFPAFVAGQRVLAQACHARGLSDECRGALEKVVAAIPEDALAQKLLGRLLKESGDIVAARRAFATVLEFNPQDAECLQELALLEHSGHEAPAAVLAAGGAAFAAGAALGEMGEEEVIEDIEILEFDEADLVEDEKSAEGHSPDALVAPEEHEDPLSTATLAELYVQQGHIDKALEIYRTVSTENHAGRIAELEAMTATAAAAAAVSSFSPAMAATAATVQEHELLQEPTLPAAGRSDAMIATLQGWLENIGRIRSCR